MGARAGGDRRSYWRIHVGYAGRPYVLGAVAKITFGFASVAGIATLPLITTESFGRLKRAGQGRGSGAWGDHKNLQRRATRRTQLARLAFDFRTNLEGYVHVPRPAAAGASSARDIDNGARAAGVTRAGGTSRRAATPWQSSTRARPSPVRLRRPPPLLLSSIPRSTGARRSAPAEGRMSRGVRASRAA